VNTAFATRAPKLQRGQLGLLMQKLHSYAGIRIDSTHNVIASSIQARMAYLGIADLRNYLAVLDDSINARAEWLALIDLLTVKETRFFRQPDAYNCLAQYVDELLTDSGAGSELSFWSAGCSHGQELYSMAMVVESVASRRQPWLQWHGIGTDISFKAIAHAQHAIYPEEAMQFIPADYCERFMDHKLGQRRKVTEDIRARTHFFHSNLLHVDSAPFADFNIIFCQNTLIYFERDRQRWIIDQLVDRLRVGGLLILGAGEDASWQHQRVSRLQ
jgi:chemotaxis methyl-accepting protein methylase